MDEESKYIFNNIGDNSPYIIKQAKSKGLKTVVRFLKDVGIFPNTNLLIIKPVI